MPGLALPPLRFDEPEASPAEKCLRWGLVTGLHGLLLFSIVTAAVQQELVRLPDSLTVRLLPQVETTKAEPAVPPPPAPTKPQHRPPAHPQPILAAKASAAPTAFTVAPQPPAPPAAAISAPPAPPAPVAVTAVRFDADYLHNPKPVYPALSRRMGEEGRVLLRVQVGTQGTATEIDLKQSSGFSRLDAAAHEAVAKWRFVPAKRGDEAIEAWVIVPISFSLQH